MNLHTALVWLREHWSLAWPVVSALLLLVLRSRTPEEWVALGERSPRWQGVIRLLRAVGLDPSKTVSALTQIVTGRAPTRSVAAADLFDCERHRGLPSPSIAVHTIVLRRCMYRHLLRCIRACACAR